MTTRKLNNQWNQVQIFCYNIYDKFIIEYATVNKQESVPPVYEPTYTDIDTCKINPPSVYNKAKFDPQIPLTLPISLDDLGTHVASCHSNGFGEQYAVSVYCRGRM